MNKWKLIIDLSGFYRTQDWTNDNIHECGKLVANAIVKAIPDYADFDKYGYDLSELVDRFKDGIFTNEEYLKAKQEDNFDVPPLEEFDYLMTELYDMADTEKWWVGTNK